MTLFRRRREPEPPPPAETPAGLVDSAETLAIEQRARLRHARRLIERTLAEQGLRLPEDRNRPLVDLCLDLRSTLFPSAPDRVPVVPGRSR